MIPTGYTRNNLRVTDDNALNKIRTCKPIKIRINSEKGKAILDKIMLPHRERMMELKK